MRRRTNPILAIGSSLLLAVLLVAGNGTTAAANSIELVQIGGDAYPAPPGGGTVVLDIILMNTTGIGSLAISAAFSDPVDAASGTNVPIIFHGSGFVAPLGAHWSNFTGVTLDTLAYGATPQGAGIPVGIAAGCNCSIGTLSFSFSSFVRGVEVGVIRPVLDGAADNFFQPVSMANGYWPVPEPGTALLLGLGLAGFAARGRAPR